MKIFQKFEVGYTQTSTSLESSTMWHLKMVAVMCFHPTRIYGWFHVPLFYSKKKRSEKMQKNEPTPTSSPLLDVKLYGRVPLMHHPLETYYKSSCQQTTTELPRFLSYKPFYFSLAFLK
jgi:hypothetical protein